MAHRNLTGNGDILSVTYGRSSGLNPQIDASYTLPLSPRETTLGLRYRRNASSVIEASLPPWILRVDRRSSPSACASRSTVPSGGSWRCP